MTHAADPTFEARIDWLLDVLRAQQESHRVLGRFLTEKRQAIRDGDIDAISDLCQQENAVAQKIGDAEKQRLVMNGDLTEMLAPTAEVPLSVREIAEHVAEPKRSQLRCLAESLRAEINAVRRESSIVAAAARALSSHMTGIMQSVNRALSRVQVYERRGRIALGSQTDYRVDVTS